jgi:hypothetical protein
MSQYSWQENDAFGSAGLLYAAGAVVASWNLCETMMLAYLTTFIKTPTGAAHKVFTALNNNKRLELLRLCAQDGTDEDARELVDTFLKQCDVCCHNRNQVAHSIYLRDFENLDTSGFVAKKLHPSLVNDMKTFDIDEETMLEIANANYLTYQFGLGIVAYLMAKPGGPLFNRPQSLKFTRPTAPPTPTKLEPRPLNHAAPDESTPRPGSKYD